MNETLNKDAFLKEIERGLPCTDEVLKKVYGYDLSFEGYAEKALCIFEKAGYTNVWDDYKKVIALWEGKNMEETTIAKKAVVNEEFEIPSFAEIEEKEIEWLIPEYIPRGQISIMVGEGGCGKSTSLCAIAAAVSAGRSTFLVEKGIPKNLGQCKPEKVLFFSAEDSAEHVLKRRLRKNGAKMDNIYAISLMDKRFEKLKFNNDFIEGLLKRYHPALCIFDPIQAFLTDRIKMSERNAMRNSLSTLVGLGEKYGTTFLIVVHTNKQSGVWGRQRMADSADIWDISRSVLLVGRVDEDEGKELRYISHEKSNYGVLGKTVLYNIEDEQVCCKGYSTKKDRDFITAKEYSGRQKPKREEAKQFVLEFLKDGEKEIRELGELAEIEGISKYALRMAKAELEEEGKIQNRNTGFRDKKFYISLTHNKDNS